MILRRDKVIKQNEIELIAIRDYEVKKAIKAKKEIRIVYNNQYMDLSVKQLRKPAIKGEALQSKYYPNQKYKLYSYIWKPQKRLSEEEFFKQNNLL